MTSILYLGISFFDLVAVGGLIFLGWNVADWLSARRNLKELVPRAIVRRPFFSRGRK